MPKKFDKDYQPKKRRGPAKPKPELMAERVSRIIGEAWTDNDLLHMADAAKRHFIGDPIITESADGQQLTSKVVSDPRGVKMLIDVAVEHESKKPNFIAVPVSPEFYKSTMAIADSAERDIEPDPNA